MHPKAKAAIRWALFGSFNLAVSGFSQYLGLDPPGILKRIFGEESLQKWAFLVTNISSDTARWLFVVIGDCALVVGIVSFMMIPMSRLFARAREVEKKIDNFQDTDRQERSEIRKLADESMRLAREAKTYVDRKERSILNIQTQTRRMLERMRLHKTGAKGPLAESPQAPKPQGTPEGT